MYLRKLLTIMISVGLLLTSCGGQETTETPMSDLDAVLTAGVGTIAASIFQTQTALAPTATETPTSTTTSTHTPVSAITLPPLSTSTLGLISTQVVILGSPTPTGTQYTPTPNPSTLSYGCNNSALIRDVTIPAGTVLKPGEKFTKTWQIANTGTCNWVYLYHLVHVSGDRMGGSPPNLGKVIEPQEWIQLSVEMRAPSDSGTYTGYWRFGDQSGNVFGATLGVSIVVTSPTKTPVPATVVPNTPNLTQTADAAAATSAAATAISDTATAAATGP